MIRPPDPAVIGITRVYMSISTKDAVRRKLDLDFRDCHTALDMTYGGGKSWGEPLPPGLSITSNNLDPAADTDLHIDFRATGLPNEAFDLCILDPPHIADAGATSIMGRRFGTARGVAGLRALIEDGVREAYRVARIGILVKVADHSHQGEHQCLSDWVKAAVPVRPYSVLHTYRSTHLRDGKHRAIRVPRNNGATYLAFRKDGHRHRDFERMYQRQTALATRTG